MAIIELSGMQVYTDNIATIEAANSPGRTTIWLKEPSAGSVTVPLEHNEVLKRIAEVDD